MGHAATVEGNLVVCFLHKADEQAALMNVRSEGENGRDADVTRCLLMTQSGHFYRQVGLAELKRSQSTVAERRTGLKSFESSRRPRRPWLHDLRA
jgi:hypothetical protein